LIIKSKLITLFQISYFILYDFRHEDLKQMLDGNKDNLKLEAMRRIIGVRLQLKQIFV